MLNDDDDEQECDGRDSIVVNPSLEMDLRRESINSILSSNEILEKDFSDFSFSAEEQKALLTALRLTYNMYFHNHSFDFLPTCYYSIREELEKSCNVGQFITTDLILLLVILLECIQVRLFQYIISKYYEGFTNTNIYEYLIHENTSEIPSLNIQKFHSRYQYSSYRLQSCTLEMPDLKRIICEFSNNAEDLLSVWIG